MRWLSTNTPKNKLNTLNYKHKEIALPFTSFQKLINLSRYILQKNQEYNTITNCSLSNHSDSGDNRKKRNLEKNSKKTQNKACIKTSMGTANKK